jgi:hypothetical protein
MADAYGTVMVARIAAPFADVESSIQRWADERKVPGFLHEDVMLCDDGVTVVMSVFFSDETSYRTLADDAQQAEWWDAVVQPMLEGEATWYDGNWRMRIDG